MNRRSLGFYLIVGLAFWGLPAVLVTGYSAIVYTLAAALPVWLFFLKPPKMEPANAPSDRLGSTAVTLLTGFTILYVLSDALFGQKLLQSNLFIVGAKSVEQVVDVANAGVSEGRGVIVLIGNVIGLLPFCLIDSTSQTSRAGRIALWLAAFVMLFYGVTSSRGALILCVLTIFLGKSSNWRRTLAGGSIAFLLFALASQLRGDYGNSGGSPLWAAVSGPYINLALMQASHCGSAAWYQFVGEFFKKFIPAFIYPKNIYSFNIETSLCIYPTLDNNVAAVSIFTWLGEIYYYTPSILTAISAGALLGGMGCIVDRQLAKNRLPVSRVAIGFACMTMLRSRTLDVLSYLIGQTIFLLCWPHLRNLARYLRRCLSEPTPAQLAQYEKDLP